MQATEHDVRAEADYRQVSSLGLKTVRDGIRWHLVERLPHRYDWSSFLPMVRAAQKAGVQVIWDLCHYGYPDDLDVWSPSFAERFGRFAGAVAQLLLAETGRSALYCPVNEISFWSWAGAHVAYMNPTERNRGGEWKRQLVRAHIAAVRAIREVDPGTRFITAEPAINVISYSRSKKVRGAAEAYRASQYEACELIAGAKEPELGGGAEFLDVVGVNFYPANQWLLPGGATIPFGHHAFRPLRDMLAETYRRHGRPLLISETGAEGSARAAWLNYVCGEVAAAMAQSIPVLGICLYPVTDYPGWENDRCCEVGLLGQPQSGRLRSVHNELRNELLRQQSRLSRDHGVSPA